jgi:hypothetical protein
MPDVRYATRSQKRELEDLRLTHTGLVPLRVGLDDAGTGLFFAMHLWLGRQSLHNHMSLLYFTANFYRCLACRR